MPEPLMKEDEVANYLGLSKSYLRKGRHHGNGPSYRKLGTAIRYRPEDVEAWLEECKRESTEKGPSQETGLAPPGSPPEEPAPEEVKATMVRKLMEAAEKGTK